MEPELVEKGIEAQRDLWLEDSFLAELPPRSIRRLERYASPHYGFQFERACMDQAPVVVVLTGVVKVFHGAAVLVDVAGSGDLINAEPSVTGTTTIGRIDASWRTEMIAIPQRDFRNLLELDKELQRAHSRAMGRRAQASDTWRRHARRRVDQRAWAFLTKLGWRHGHPIGPADIRLDVNLHPTELASAIAASRSSTDAALQKLARMGKLTAGFSGLVLHEPPTSAEELELSFRSWNVR